MTITTSRPLNEMRIEFSEYNLDNGLHVVLHQDNSKPIVCINIWYHVGSKDEEQGRTGFAHLFEHMMFQGSKNTGKAEHFKYIQQVGGILNGGTSQDITTYFETVPSNHLELVLWLESDRMGTLNVTQENFDNQREVVKEEKRQHYDNAPYGSMPANLFRKAYNNNHPYNWIPIGSMKDLNDADLSYAQYFYRRFYTPANAALAISGDIEINEAKQLVEKYFGDISSNGFKKNNYTSNTFHKGEKIDTIYENVQLPAVYTAYKIPVLTDDDIYPLQLLSLILSNGRSSRLYKSVVYEKKISKSVNSYLWNLELGGLLLISSTGMKESRVDAIKEIIDNEIVKIKIDGVSEAEIEKAKNVTETYFTKKLQTNLGISDLLAYYSTFYKNTERINSDISEYLKVTRKDIINSANKYLTHDNRVVLNYLPLNNNKTQSING